MLVDVDPSGIEVGVSPPEIEISGETDTAFVVQFASPNYSPDCDALTMARVIGRVDGENIVGALSRR